MIKIFSFGQLNIDFQKQLIKTNDDLVEISRFAEVSKLLEALSNESCDLILSIEDMNQNTVWRSLLNEVDEEIFFTIKAKRDFDTSDVINTTQQHILKKNQIEADSIESRLSTISSHINFSVRNELVNMFCSKQEKYLYFLREQKNNLEMNAIKFEMHNLKSSSANIGAIRLPQICNLLESSDSSFSVIKIKILLQAAFDECKKINTYLNNVYLKK